MSKRQMIVVPYHTSWPDSFQKESESLLRVLGQQNVRLHHIGSTAIEGMCAKPIIDIMGVVKSLSIVDELSEQIEDLGYEGRGEHEIPGRRYFRKGEPTNHTHHLHVFAEGSPHIVRHLAFRDYLRANPARAKEYSDLKMHLAHIHRYDPAAYADGRQGSCRRSRWRQCSGRRQSEVTLSLSNCIVGLGIRQTHVLRFWNYPFFQKDAEWCVTKSIETIGLIRWVERFSTGHSFRITS